MNGRFTPENQPKDRPGRGKSERTKILEAMKRTGKNEEGFYDLLVKRAYNPDDSFAFGELLKRLAPIKKSVAPLINFELPEDAKPHEKADYVIKAIASGEIPADIGAIVINGITSMLKIQEVTDFEERLAELEKVNNDQS